MNLRPPIRRLLPFAIAAVIGAGVGAGVYALTSGGSGTPAAATVVVPAQPASSTSTVGSLTQLYKQDAPGIVDITVTSTSAETPNFFNPFGPQSKEKQEAEGTGFEIDESGDIVTAEHVVAGAEEITVQFEDGSTAKAKLVGSDTSTDTAVIQVNVPASRLHPLSLGDSTTVEPGQDVVAIGSPFGLTETMTAGIVSATNRTITAPNKFSISGAVQTDAAINHGNSGGPLIDVATNTVIGINDQIESDTNDNAGIGFAVPIDAAKRVAQTLIAGGTVRHAYLGATIGSARGGAELGCVVNGGPAKSAGLKAGDVISRFGGTAIESADALISAVTGARPGEKVTLRVVRHGSTKHVSVTLGTQPESTENNCSRITQAP